MVPGRTCSASRAQDPDNLLVLLGKDGGLQLLVGHDDVEQRQDVEVERQVEVGEDRVHEDVLAVEDVQQEQVEDVGEELSQPGPERGVDVHRVLLVPALHRLRLQGPGTDCMNLH